MVLPALSFLGDLIRKRQRPWEVLGLGNPRGKTQTIQRTPSIGRGAGASLRADRGRAMLNSSMFVGGNRGEKHKGGE